MALQWLDGTVVEKKVWSEGLFTLHVNVPKLMPYLPGQFLQLGVKANQHDKEIQVNRPYSAASPHGQRVEFYIVLVEDGELTPRLWDMSVGDPLCVGHRAAGSFTLAKAPEHEVLWLIATGTGLAPYIAMLRTNEPWEKYKHIVVVHGVRFHSDFGYADELNAFANDRSKNFSYVPMTTREETGASLKGRIPVCLENGTLEEAAGHQITAENSTVLLCGNPAMLDDVEAILGKRNMKKHRTKSPGHIVVERYW